MHALYAQFRSCPNSLGQLNMCYCSDDFRVGITFSIHALSTVLFVLASNCHKTGASFDWLLFTHGDCSLGKVKLMTSDLKD